MSPGQVIRGAGVGKNHRRLCGGRDLRQRGRLVCFGRVRRDWILPGLVSGVLAASSTAGALVAFGIHLGTPARPFNAIGALLLGPGAAQIYGFSAGPTIAGVLLEIAATIACGLLHARLVARRGGHLALWSIAIAAGALCTSWILARFGVGLAALLPVGNLVVLAVVLALSLAIGIRFALQALYRE